MSRSIKKGPYVDAKLLKKVEKLDAAGEKKAIKTWARGSSVHPKFVRHKFLIHSGQKHVEVFITETMVGHKLGEFVKTRKFTSHSKRGYEKPAA